MKKVLLSLGFAISLLSAKSQVIFSSSFESWTNTDPDGWVVGTPEINADSVNQITAGTVYGNSAAELRNPVATHKRMKTIPVSIVNGTTYTITYWVKGSGSIRAGLFNGGSGFTAYQYSTYDSINSSNWAVYSHTITADSTSSTGQFIISTRYTSVPTYIQVDSFVVSATSGGGGGTTSIYSLQYSTTAPFASSFNNQTVSTGGIVTAVKSPGYWIQSGSGPWTGIYVFDSISASTVTMGDSVTMNALVFEYNNLTELKNINNFVKVSNGNSLPAFSVITTGDANTEPYESVLVQCQNAVCTNPNSGFGQWKIYSAGDTVFVDDLMYTYVAPALNQYYTVSGPLYYSFSEWKIEPRMPSDVLLVTGIEESALEYFSVFPNPSAGTFWLKGLQTNDLIKIYDVNGRLVNSLSCDTSNEMQINLFTQGLFLIQVTNQKGVFSKLILINE